MQNIDYGVLNQNLKRDISQMFQEGNVTEKDMALTALAVVKAYF